MAGSWPQLERALLRVQRLKNISCDEFALGPALAFLEAYCAFPAGESLLSKYGSYISDMTRDGTPYGNARKQALAACKEIKPQEPKIDEWGHPETDTLLALRSFEPQKATRLVLADEAYYIKQVMNEYFPWLTPSNERRLLGDWWVISSRIISQAENTFADDCRSLIEVRKHGFNCTDGAIMAQASSGDTVCWSVCAAATLLVDELRNATDLQKDSEIAGSSNPMPKTPKLVRNLTWYKWYHSAGIDTYHSHANIRDRWNRERPDDAISKRNDTQGRDTVRKGIEAASAYLKSNQISVDEAIQRIESQA